MHVIATAGHVDHGKSTLVRALTGMEPDRWEEEHRRGLTIGLGFGWTTLANGEQVAFVDVPGHEKFVPTMLAGVGVGSVPAALLVVAADAGWMPQSSEHLSALDALGVRHGLLVISRADLADPEPARRQSLDIVARSGLGALSTVVVSAVTGQGLDQLRAEISQLVKALPAPDRQADVRLWVDRRFTLRGTGTVVTGTLAAGTVRVGDTLSIAATGQVGKVRGLHALGEPRDEVTATARVAVNLRGVDRADVRTGDALVAPDRWLTATSLDVAVPEADRLPGRLVLHLGSAAVPVQLRPLGKNCRSADAGTPFASAVRRSGAAPRPGPAPDRRWRDRSRGRSGAVPPPRCRRQPGRGSHRTGRDVVRPAGSGQRTYVASARFPARRRADQGRSAARRRADQPLAGRSGPPCRAGPAGHPPRYRLGRPKIRCPPASRWTLCGSGWTYRTGRSSPSCSGEPACESPRVSYDRRPKPLCRREWPKPYERSATRWRPARFFRRQTRQDWPSLAWATPNSRPPAGPATCCGCRPASYCCRTHRTSRPAFSGACHSRSVSAKPAKRAGHHSAGGPAAAGIPGSPAHHRKAARRPSTATRS